MPPVNPNSDLYLLQYLRGLDDRLRAIETQQQNVYTDGAGRRRAQVGLLPNGDYGIQVVDPTGVAREVFPVAAASTVGPLSTTSSSFVAISGSPEVSAYIGASGDALVTVSATINTPTITSPTVVGGRIGLSVDGATPTGIWMEAGYNGGSYPSALPETEWPASSAQLLSQTVGTVTPGEHTFGLVYSNLLGSASVFFTAIAIVVQPL